MFANWTNGKRFREEYPLAPFEKKGEYLRLMFATGQTVCFREESPWPPLKKGGIPLINIYELTNGKPSGRILRARFEIKGEYLSTNVYDWTNECAFGKNPTWPYFEKRGNTTPR
jgi:hypothetical protein